MLRSFLGHIKAPAKSFLVRPSSFVAVPPLTKRHCSANAAAAKHYDVIIVGGGPAGLSMACAIGKLHHHPFINPK